MSPQTTHPNFGRLRSASVTVTGEDALAFASSGFISPASRRGVRRGVSCPIRQRLFIVASLLNDSYRLM